MNDPFSIPPPPFSLFKEWADDAAHNEPCDPEAAALATVDQNGLPNVRVVLIRQVDENGFTFFTNTESEKGKELISSGKAALNYHWKTLKRQVRIRGSVTRISAEESDAYYHSRPLGSRIGAWASIQSAPLADRDTLLHRVKAFEEKFGSNPPRPPHWGGFRLSPQTIEFWQEGEFRLHNRILYEKQGDMWITKRLFP